MPRFTHVTTGVVVSVSDELAATLDQDYVPVEGSDDAPEGYSSQKVDDLKAEIARRNEGRNEADLIAADGKKADLVAALEADDSKSA